MKVVINRCYGGFGLSKEAFELLLNKKGIEFETRPAEFRLKDGDLDYYKKGQLGVEEAFLWDHSLTENRSDPDLIAVVEELGEESASGWAAELKIVDIPDDVVYDIHEYDGIEWVAERHRTWS